MLTLKPLTADRGWRTVHPQRVPATQVTSASWANHPPARMHVELLGPCFKTGRIEEFRQHPEHAGTRTGPPKEARAQGPRLPWRPPVGGFNRSPPQCRSQQPMLAGTPRPTRGATTQSPSTPAQTGAHDFPSIRFSLGNFKHSLTLFSKFFSSFPRGTSSLSVPRTYLALDGTYHPIGAAFPSNPTLGQHLVAQQGPAVDGAVTLFGVPFQGTCTRPAAEVASQDYNSGSSTAPGFSVWAIPGSLAATKGILVGFSSSA